MKHEGSPKKILTEKDIQSLEKEAHLTGSLGFDSLGAKYNNAPEDEVIGVHIKKPDFPEQDFEKLIKHGEERHKESRSSIFTNEAKKIIEMRDNLESLRTKFSKEIKAINNIDLLKKDVATLKEEQKGIEEKKQFLEKKLDKIIEVRRSGNGWQEFFTEEQVKTEIMKDSKLAKNFKTRLENDKFFSVISLGIAKPASALEIINWQASQMMLIERSKIFEELFPLVLNLDKINKEIVEKLEKVAQAYHFMNSNEWKEFYKMKGLEEGINKGIKNIEDIPNRSSLN